MKRGWTLLALLGALGGIVLAAAPVAADPPAPIFVRSELAARVRLQIAGGLAMPCDSSADHMLFDATLAPGETWQGTTSDDCVCVRHTTASFSNSEWTTPRLACRPRVCRGRRCWPAGDGAIRIPVR
ncbi:MAG TPA: hypothetical protein VIF62_12745 [Labilithrix sp.]